MSGGWTEALRVAAVRFGIAPEGFWRLSLREWRALTETDAGALGRRELDALMRRHPDGPEEVWTLASARGAEG